MDRLRPTPNRLPIAHLKRCPLCDAVNAATNGECFVCGWHGDFVHDPEAIHEGVKDLIKRCPDLAGAISRRQPTLWNRFLSRFRRRIDFRV